MAHNMTQATISELTLRENIKNEAGTTVFDQGGPVFTDTVTGTKYNIIIENGVITKVEV